MKFNINGIIIEVADDILSKAVTDKTETLEVKSEDIVLKSKIDFDSYTENIKKEGKEAYTQIGRKELFKELGLDIEGTGAHKALDKSIKALNDWNKSGIEKAVADSGKDPNKKIDELKADLEALRGGSAEKDTKYTTLESEYSNYKKDIVKTSKLRSLLPDNLVMPIEDTLLLMNSKLNLDLNDQNTLYGIGIDGQPLKDDNRNLMTAKTIVDGFFNDNSYLTKGSTGGAGGADSASGNGKQTYEAFGKEMQEAGHSLNGPEYLSEMDKRETAGTLG